MDFDTAWCPVCDKQIAPKRIQVLTTAAANNNGIARQRVAQNRPITKTKTVIDQGPCPLYCSDECKMADMLHQRQDVSAPPTYTLYRTSRSSNISPPSDNESDSLSSHSTLTTTDASSNSPTSENHPCLSSSTPIACQPKQRSRSFLSGRSERSSGALYAPSSLPTTSTLLNSFGDFEGRSPPPTADHYLLSQFQGSFSRRSESRVSLYSGPSSPTSRSPPSISALGTSPRRERPILASGAQGKLLVPDVSVRVPTRPSASRRESSASLVSLASTSSAPGAITMRHRTGSVASIASSRASMKSPLARYGSDFGDDERDYHDLSEEDECAFEDSDSPTSPGLGGFGFSGSPKRPTLLNDRAWSFDAVTFSTVRETRRERRRSEKKEDRQSYNPDGKKLFLFPTD